MRGGGTVVIMGGRCGSAGQVPSGNEFANTAVRAVAMMEKSCAPAAAVKNK